MKFYRNRAGQGMTEYLLILAAIITLAYFLIGQFGGPLKTQIANMVTTLNSNPVGS